jgi:hypothetical protein
MPKNIQGIGYAFLGVLIFSFTLPMVKLALPGFSPWTLTFGRAALAGEVVTGKTLLAASVVVICVAITQRVRLASGVEVN